VDGTALGVVDGTALTEGGRATGLPEGTKLTDGNSLGCPEGYVEGGVDSEGPGVGLGVFVGRRESDGDQLGHRVLLGWPVGITDGEGDNEGEMVGPGVDVGFRDKLGVPDGAKLGDTEGTEVGSREPLGFLVGTTDGR